MDRMRVFDIIYALAASDGRGSALFGDDGQAAREAFSRSLTGAEFPELWFEIPLLGEPWLDFHSLVSYGDVAGPDAAYAGHGAAYADALAWFAGQKPGAVRQLALSYDTHLGEIDHPAVQLLVNGRDASVPIGFLHAAGRPDAGDSYRTFVQNMPQDWYACYVGAFPERQAAGKSPWVRVECIVGDDLQQAYVEDASTLRAHLSSVGLECASDDAIAGMRELARSPFPLEFQFNVSPDGSAQPVISASVRFQPVDWIRDERRESVDSLLRWIEGRGLADERWNQLASSSFAKRVTRGNESITISCFPAFVKLRWREGHMPDAKVYLMACAC